MTAFTMQLRRDPNGRIVEKNETVAGSPTTWTYTYDKAGRLAEAKRDGRTVCNMGYDRDGRRSNDYFPHLGEGYRNYRYAMDDRLLLAGNNQYTHDKNGFRATWNHGGKRTRYHYSPDCRLLEAAGPDGSELTFDHDEHGRRSAKHRNGHPMESYTWRDLVSLSGFHDGRNEFEFAYSQGERTPYAMRRDDGAAFSLHYDQVGSLRVVADSVGNVIKEIMYDPFGNILKDSDPALRIPIGFAGGLYDPDLGFVRFGWRDYDPFTSRWTAPDPMGDAGGDPDWYGYCLDDPVNGTDPLGLFRFGKRPLDIPIVGKALYGTGATEIASKLLPGILPQMAAPFAKKIDDKYNLQFAHEQGFWEDGSGENIGLGTKGLIQNENIQDYDLENKHYDDKRMRRSLKSLGEQTYHHLGKDKNNCQDFSDSLRSRYAILDRGDKMR